MKKMRSFIAAVLALALVVSLLPAPAVFAAEENDTAIYDLMTDDMVDPVGLDNPAPVFSWKMRSSVVGQRQTAYQIIVKNADTPVWDSGKVETDISVGIVYGGEALLSSTTYSWSVTVWDKDGTAIQSPEATFEMALLEEDAFDDTHFISYQALPNTTPSVYTIDFDFKITSRAVGFLFGAESETKFMLWQFNSYQGIFKPHINTAAIEGHSVNICQTAQNESFRILKGNGDKTEAAATANASDLYHARIAVNGAVIQTYLGTSAENLVLLDTYTHTSTVYLNRMGFRQPSNESGCVDNLIVTDGAGKVYYENRFEDAYVNDIANAKMVVEEGRLQMQSGAGVCLQYADTNITSYSIDWDFEINNIAASLVFGATSNTNHMMWQFSSRTGSFVAYKRVENTLPSVGSVNISQSSASTYKILQGTGSGSADDKANQGITYHARVEVTGNVVKTLVAKAGEELKHIHTYTHTAAIPLGKLGVRQGSSEKSYYDNIVAKDRYGNIVYKNSYDNELQNDFSNGVFKVENGRLFAQFYNDIGNRGVVLQEDHPKPGKNAMPAYRKQITVKKDLVSAKLYTAGLGVYESYINGQRVGRLQSDGSVKYDELKPGFTKRELRQLYSSFDVTWMLQTGDNVLGGVVTNGWWMHVGSLNKGKETAYLAKLILTYADGTQEVVSTDTSWKAQKYGAHCGTGIYPGERYDATVDQNWMLPGYDDSLWPNVKINTEFSGQLSAWKGVPIVVREDLERKPQSITVYQGATGAVADERYGDIVVLNSYADGDTISLSAGQTLMVDFGQNAAGWEYMEIEGARGTVVTVEHGEWINEAGGVIARGNDGPGGSMFSGSNRLAVAKTVYTMSGDGIEKYHPSLTYYGFQYIEITATADITVHKLRAQVVTSVQSETSSMVTSDEDVNKLLSNITWGMYSNYLSIPTDCPQRDERHGWTGDAQIFSQAGTYLTYAKSFLVKYLQDLRDSQRQSDGAYPDIAPYTHDYGYHANKDGSYAYGEVGWGDAGIIIPWYLYMMYGDTAVIKEHWASMRKYMDVYMESTGGDGPTSGSFDHLTPETSDKVPVGNLLGVAYFAWDALLMADMAEAIGETEAAEHYRAVYQREKAIFQQRYVAEDGTLIRYEQTALLFALYLDLLPNAQSVEAVTDQLVNSIAQYGNLMMTGFLGTAIITNTLTKIGRSDVAYTLLLQHENPSWLYSVDQGATTVWERWNTYTVADGFGPASMNSFNHYAYGAVAGWMYKTLAGIGYDEENPGFKNIILAPAFDSRLPQITSSYDSAYGTIETSTNISGGTITYTATIPANTTAVARIPVAEGQVLTVNGKALADLSVDTDGIRYVGTEAGIAQLQAVSGSFGFVISEAAPTAADWSSHYCQHCKKNVAWKPYTLGLTEGGHYYLATDTDINDIERLPGAGSVTCLHLNGKTLRQTVKQRLFNVAGKTLNIMDHPENRGQLIKASDAIDRGGIFNVVGGILNIYGGTMLLPEGVESSHGAIVYANETSRVNMYGGAMRNGTVTSSDTVSIKEGGSIHLDNTAQFVLHDGIIEGGSTPTYGGNVYLKGSASFVMNGGTVSGGSAESGGNFYACGTSSVTIHGGTVTGGVSNTDGGNFHMDTGTTLTIDEDQAATLITLGTAVRGGNISLMGAAATVDAGTVSYGKSTGTGSEDGGGNVRVDENSSFTLNEDEGKESTVTFGRSEAANFGGNIYNYGAFTMNGGKVLRGYTSSAAANIGCRKNTVTINGGFVGEAVRGVSILVNGTGRLKISGGTVSGGLMGGEENRNVVIWDAGVVEVSGGNMLGNYSGAGGCINATKGATVTISGGTFSGSQHSDIAVALVQADNVKNGPNLTISGGSIASLYVSDDHSTYDPAITVSGKSLVSKLTRGGAQKPLIAFALTDGASVTFSEETLGETFGSGESASFIHADNGLYPSLEGTSLKWVESLVDPSLKFCGASVTLYTDLAVNFKVDNALLGSTFTEPYVVFRFGDIEETAQVHSVSGGMTIFRFRNIAPHLMGQTITATLYAKKDGIPCEGETRQYSLMQYCYNTLNKYTGSYYAELRTLLVDLLNYGALAQQYVNNAVAAQDLVNASLTEEQKACGTPSDAELVLTDIRQEETLDNATVTWGGGGLALRESVAIRLKLQSDSIDGLSVKFEMDGKTWEVSEFVPVADSSGCWYVYFRGMGVNNMRQSVKAVVYKDDQQVSNALTYSAESYVANHYQNEETPYLAELVKAVIRYGDSAWAYVN